MAERFYFLDAPRICLWYFAFGWFNKQIHKTNGCP